MAKKSVATLQTGSKRLTKAINMVKKKRDWNIQLFRSNFRPKTCQRLDGQQAYNSGSNSIQVN
jgi:hypothetical protein